MRHAVQARADQGGIERAGHRSWAQRALWDHLEAAGHPTLTVAWPATAPADRWPGTHIDETFAIPSGRDFSLWAIPPHATAPACLRSDLKSLRVHPADDLHPELQAFLGDAPPPPDPAPLTAALAHAATIQAIASHLATTEPWTLLCLTHELIARTRAATPDPAHLAGAYGLLDLMLAHLVTLAGAGATILLASAHGLALTAAPPRPTRNGLLLAAGPGIPHDALHPGARLVDVAPTLLARYGLVAPSDGHPIPGFGAASILRPTVRPPPSEPADPDPAEDLLAQGYRDTTSPDAQHALRHAAIMRLQNLGAARLERPDLPGAAEALEAALAGTPRATSGTDPLEAAIIQRLARVHTALGDPAPLLRLAQRLLAGDPDQPWAHLILGIAAALTPGADPAPHLVRARSLGGDDAPLRIQLGGLELLRGRPEPALHDFRHAATLDPASPEAAFGEGLAHTALGDMSAAEHALRRTVALQHNQPLAHYHLGLALHAQGRLPEAVATLATAAAQAPASAQIAASLHQARTALAHDLAAAATPQGQSGPAAAPSCSSPAPC